MDEYKTVQLEWLRPTQIKECREKADIAFLPLGALEWHGLQNPIGLDAIKSHHICCLAAQKLNGGAVAPPLVWGVPRDSFFMDTMDASTTKQIAAAYGTAQATVDGHGFHGGVDPQAQWLHYQALVRMSLEQIAGFGFRSIYLLTGHAPLIHFVRPVAVAFTRATRMAGRIVTTTWANETDLVAHGGDHAGRWETSLLMAVDPASVDLQELKDRPNYRGVGADKNAVESTPQLGAQWLADCAAALAEDAKRLVEAYPIPPLCHSHHTR